MKNSATHDWVSKQKKLRKYRSDRENQQKQRLWAELNEFNETNGGERRSFTFGKIKKHSIYRL